MKETVAMNGKTYLGDEVHEALSELHTVRQELELTKMALERKDGENSVLRQDLAECRLRLEEKSADVTSLTTLLEQQASALTIGITRVKRQREVRHMTGQDRLTRDGHQPGFVPKAEQGEDEAQARVSEFAPQPPQPPQSPPRRPAGMVQRQPLFPIQPDDSRLPPVRPIHNDDFEVMS